MELECYCGKKFEYNESEIAPQFCSEKCEEAFNLREVFLERLKNSGLLKFLSKNFAANAEVRFWLHCTVETDRIDGEDTESTFKFRTSFKEDKSDEQSS